MLCVEGGLEPFIRHLKAHKVLLTRIFFSFIILLQLRWPIESKFSQICYVMLVGINQGGILTVFDNYQMCPVPFFFIYFNMDSSLRVFIKMVHNMPFSITHIFLIAHFANIYEMNGGYSSENDVKPFT